MTEDEKRQIVDLLCGPSVRDEHGLTRQSYLRDGSPEELAARRALARLLRTSSPLDLGLRFVLADLIDPDCDAVERKIRFERRRKGKPSSAHTEKTISEFIWALVEDGVKREAAFHSAMDRFGLKRSRILKIWSDWQPILKRVKGRPFRGSPARSAVPLKR
jgi:hypothetical protein